MLNNWLNKLERKYAKYGISNLMLYIAVLNLVVYFLINWNGFYVYYKLVLDPSLVLKGEVWRLISFIFIPPLASPIFIAFVLYFYYFIGRSLESFWGTFRFNLYYLIGVLATILAAFITGDIVTPVYLNLSLFLAFAFVFPNYEILLFFILPVKVKYLAIIDWIFLIYTILFSPLAAKAAAIAAIVNFFIFFGQELMTGAKTKRQVHTNRKRFGYENNYKRNSEPFHKCTVCGITDIDDPYMEFRYCVECNGHHGYCKEHLHNHEHIK